MDSTSVYGLELLVLEGTGGKALTTDPRDPCRQFLSCPSQRLLLGSIFVALSCLVTLPEKNLQRRIAGSFPEQLLVIEPRLLSAWPLVNATFKIRLSRLRSFLSALKLLKNRQATRATTCPLMLMNTADRKVTERSTG